jgi:cytoskeleton protein RodZ
MSTTEKPVAKDIALDTTQETAITVAHESLEQLHLPDVPPPPAVSTLAPLRTLREGQGRSIEDIASALRLSQAQINSLEDSRWDSLPGAAYVKGFLRNYARTLGVDAQPYIDDYTAQTQPRGTTTAAHEAPAEAANRKVVSTGAEVLRNDPTSLPSFNASGEEKTTSKGLATMVSLLIAATLAFLLYWERGLWLPKVEPYFNSISTWFGSTNSTSPKTSATLPPAAAQAPAVALDTPAASPTPDIKPTAPPVSSFSTKPATIDRAVMVSASTPASSETSNSQTSVANIPAAAAVVKPNDIKKPATGPIRALTLRLSKAAWIEVRDSGNNVLYYGTKPVGSQTLKGNAPLSIVIGAADAVALKVDGQAFDVQSKAQGNVARFSIQ